MLYYIVHLSGYDDEMNTWEPEWNLNCENLIRDYLARREYEQIESILGATSKMNPKREQIYFVVQYTTRQKELIPIAQAYQRFPQMVLNYFEERLIWSCNSMDNLHILRDEEIRQMRSKTNNFKGGFDKKYVIEAICGVINSNEGLLILVKWKDHNIVEIVKASEVHKHSPDKLLSYYNERIDWKDPSNTNHISGTETFGNNIE